MVHSVRILWVHLFHQGRNIPNEDVVRNHFLPPVSIIRFIKEVVPSQERE